MRTHLLVPLAVAVAAAYPLRPSVSPDLAPSTPGAAPDGVHAPSPWAAHPPGALNAEPGVPEAAAQDIVISGRVTDAETGQPLSGVQVHVVGTGVGTLTDAMGAYSLSLGDDAVGTRIEVRASLIGYGTASRVVELEGDTPAVDFTLATQAVGLEAIVVEGETMPQRNGANPARSVDAMRGYALSRSVTGPPVAPPPSERWRYAPPVDREGYAHIEENPFLSAGANPLSTFGIDVDRASYANVRRFLLRENRLPPADAVRIEELVNYFPYTYENPGGDAPFAVHTDVVAAPWRPEHRLLRVAMRGQPLDLEEPPASNLVFLIDVSGSMQSYDKLPLLKQAFRLLVSQLRRQDRVSIVVYAGAAGLVLPPTRGDRKQEILAAIDALEAGGSTAGGAGIRLAYDVARRHHVKGGNNRVILATDGDFNVGASSDAEMVRLIEEKREQGTFLTVLGFGTGNLQDAKMEQIADHGNGNFAYIDTEREARKVLVAEMGGTLHTIAKDVKIQVEFNPAVVRGYRLIGYENRVLAAEDFDDDRKDAGELGAGHTVTALYEVVPVGARSDVDIREPGALRYGSGDGRSGEGAGSADDDLIFDGDRPATDDELAFVKLRYKRPDGDRSTLLTQPVVDRVGSAGADLRFAASVAAFGMLLRDSEHRGGADWKLVADLATGALGEDADGYRGEFLRMVEAARALKPIEASVARRE